MFEIKKNLSQCAGELITDQTSFCLMQWRDVFRNDDRNGFPASLCLTELCPCPSESKSTNRELPQAILRQEEERLWHLCGWGNTPVFSESVLCFYEDKQTLWSNRLLFILVLIERFVTLLLSWHMNGTVLLLFLICNEPWTCSE